MLALVAAAAAVSGPAAATRMRTPPVPRRAAAVAVASASTAPPVIVIGSGIGGLSCACMLAKYGTPVTVVESHEHAGGCAHSFEVKDFTFDSGPSLWAGLSRPSVNPLRQVLDVVGEADSIEWVEYDGWGMVLPDDDDSFFFKTGDADSWDATLKRLGGPEATAQWKQLLECVASVRPPAPTWTTTSSSSVSRPSSSSSFVASLRFG